MADAVVSGPDILLENLSNFHDAHFSSTSVQYFAEHFLGPVAEEGCTEEADDDGLGYYEDGVKRTLTDEQIAIFRHSEIEALLRDDRHAKEAVRYESPDDQAAAPMMDEAVFGRDGSPAIEHTEPMAEQGLEDGELDEGTAPQPPRNQNNKKNKRKKKKPENKRERAPQPKGFFKQTVKPDLRKRTWDMVDTGLAKLDYDEDTNGASVPAHAVSRRRISYDDD